MITFLKESFLVALVVATIIAGITFLVGLSIRELRPAMRFGLFGAVLGFVMGTMLFAPMTQDSIFNHPEALLAIFIGAPSAAAGYLMGFGVCCLKAGEHKVSGAFLSALGLAVPLTGIGAIMIAPKLETSELQWWHEAMTKGVTAEMEENAQGHLSNETKQKLASGLSYAKPGSIQPAAIRLMYRNGIGVSSYVPLPADIAYDMAKNPSQVHDTNFAKNPSLPRDVIEALSARTDLDFLSQLCCNKSLPNDVARNLLEKFESMLSKNTDNPTNWTARGAIEILADNPASPPDVLEHIAGKEDKNLLVKVARNPSLPPDVAVLLLQKFRSEIGPSGNMQMDPDAISSGLGALAHNRSIPNVVFEEMIKMDDLKLLKIISVNPSLPPSAAESLLDKYLKLLTSHENEPDKKKWDSTWNNLTDGLRKLATNSSLSPIIIGRLCEQNDPLLLRNLAKNPALPDIFIVLLNNKFEAIKDGIRKQGYTDADDEAWRAADVGLAALAKHNKSASGQPNSRGTN